MFLKTFSGMQQKYLNFNQNLARECNMFYLMASIYIFICLLKVFYNPTKLLKLET